MSINYSGRYYIPNLILFIGWQQLSYSYLSLLAPPPFPYAFKITAKPRSLISDSAVKSLICAAKHEEASSALA